MSTQFSPHIDLGAAHTDVDMHPPFEQNIPDGQAFPHAPQLAKSVRRSTQAPEQIILGAAHIDVGAHAP